MPTSGEERGEGPQVGVVTAWLEGSDPGARGGFQWEGGQHWGAWGAEHLGPARETVKEVGAPAGF